VRQVLFSWVLKLTLEAVLAFCRTDYIAAYGFVKRCKLTKRKSIH